MIDLESVGFRGVPPDEIVKSAEAFVEESHRLWCQPVFVYVNQSDWSALGNPSDSTLTECPLWVANYGVSKPLIPPPWRERGWTLWQWDGDKGQRLPDGRDSDFIWFAGDTIEQLRQYAGVTCNVEPPPHPVIDSWSTVRGVVAELESDRNKRLRSSDD